MTDIFKKREQFKPFEYPQLVKFIDLIHNTFWTHSEVDFTADVNDYLVNLSVVEKDIFRKSLLGIAQIEVDVKTFWGDIYKHLPKPEVNGLGATFAGNEWIHSQAYSHILTILGLEKDFDEINTIPILVKKRNFNQEKLSGHDIVSKVFYFTIGIENASLFSQFGNILSFTRFKGLMKNTSNIISWTSADEQNHANAGVALLNIIFDENPQLREVYTQEYVSRILHEYMVLEDELLSWIYEKGETGFFTKEDMLNYMRYRLDNSIIQMGFAKVFNITPDQYRPMKWFDEEVFSDALDDFFAKRPTDYTKHDKSFSMDDIFGDS